MTDPAPKPMKRRCGTCGNMIEWESWCTCEKPAPKPIADRIRDVAEKMPDVHGDGLNRLADDLDDIADEIEEKRPAECTICHQPLLHSESLSYDPPYVHMECRKREWPHTMPDSKD